MTHISKPQDWNADFEDALFRRVAAAHAPSLLADPPEVRGPETPEEVEGVVEYYRRLAAHDAFIVQAVSHGLARLDFDSEFQLKLARQVGDDGHHAVVARERVALLRGAADNDRIDENTAEHWQLLDDLPYRDLAGFLAFQFHYELYIQARLRLEGRTARIRAKQFGALRSAYAQNNEAGDELVHRINIVEWWQARYAAATPEQREIWKQEIVAADNEAQRRLNPYLRYRFVTGRKAWGADITDSVAFYDGWRREVLAYLLEVAPDELPALVSLAAH